jgi:hypothetical protein
MLPAAQRCRIDTVALLAAVAFGVLFAPPPQRAAAEGYPRLHVVALSQRVDRAWVAPGGVFHVTIHVKVAQRRDRLDDLILGAFDNCEIISNETVRSALPDGTDFVERLAVQALAPGAATISPAYIDADDPALGKPMRFSSNAVRVEVRSALPSGPSLGFHVSIVRLLLSAAIVAGTFAATFVVFALFARRRRRPVAVAPIIVAAPAPAPPAGERLVRAAAVYQSTRSAATLMALREVLFELADVAPGATLVDALRNLGERDARVRSALIAAEDAAFGPAAERAAAGDALLAAVAEYTGTAPASEDAWTR